MVVAYAKRTWCGDVVRGQGDADAVAVVFDVEGATAWVEAMTCQRSWLWTHWSGP